LSRFVYNKNTKQATVTAGLTDADYLIPAINKSYKSDDTADTTIDSSDYIPFYDSSTNSTKKILVSNAHFGGASVPTFTMAEWEAMTDAQKAEYDGKLFVISDDFNGMSVDDELSDTSVRPVQNKVITEEINSISDELLDMNNILGAKNILPNNATTQVVNGVTFTVNSNGSITVSGTATAETWYYVTDYTPIAWSNDSYLFSGRGTASTNINYFVALYDSSKTFLREYRNNVSDTDTIIVQSSDASYMRVDIVVPNGATVSGTFYPMIRPASIQDNTYVPYAMTNRELTDDRAWEWATFNVSSGWSASIGLAYMNRPFRADKSSVMSYMKIYGQIRKTGSQTVSNGTLIATLADLSIIPSSFRNYSIPFVTYDTSTGYIHLGFAFTTLDGTFKVRTNDSSFLTALNDGHIFHFSAMV